ncbi:hypothetical protein CF328_g5393 [Tilletia controversa]|nr:hypothetical protein CF328_g5393 [Tilletia controversa]
MAARPRSRHGTPSLYPPHLTSLPAITFAPSLRVMAQVRVSAGTRPTQDAVTDTIPPFDQHHRLYSSPRTVISPGLHHLTLASLFSPDSGIVFNSAAKAQGSLSISLDSQPWWSHPDRLHILLHRGRSRHGFLTPTSDIPATTISIFRAPLGVSALRMEFRQL